MTVQSLCLEPHPILRRAARSVHVEEDNVRPLARSLIETMRANDGIGLAAPQIGRDVQVFVANPSQVRGEELVVVNPVIVTMRGRTWSGVTSRPGESRPLLGEAIRGG